MPADHDQVAALAALAARLEAAGHWVSLDYRVTEKTAAEEFFDVTPRTMRWWREEGRAPPFVVLGGRITYRLEHLLAYIEARTHAGSGKV